MEQVFREHSRYIRIYVAKETIVDPIEKNVELTEFNPYPIKAIVADLTFAQAQWKIPGVTVDKTKEIIIEKKNRSLLELSQKIEVDGEFYEGWRVNGKMQIREEGNYLKVYIYYRKSN